MSETVRISHLRIAATGRRGVPMVESMVSNALRTQLGAINAQAGRGLLVIRRLDLGPVTSRRDQAGLNRTVALALRALAARALPFDDPGIDAAPAAVFPDPLTPLSAVMRALGAARPVPRSWPLRAVFGEVLALPAPTLAAALLARAATEAYAFPAMLALLDDLGPQRDAVVAGLPDRLAQTLCTALILPACAARTTAPHRPTPIVVPLGVPPRRAGDIGPAALRLLAAYALCTAQRPARPVTAQTVAVLAATWRGHRPGAREFSPVARLPESTENPRAAGDTRTVQPPGWPDRTPPAAVRHLPGQDWPARPAAPAQHSRPDKQERPLSQAEPTLRDPAITPVDRTGRAARTAAPEPPLPEAPAETVGLVLTPIRDGGDLSPLAGLACLIRLIDALFGVWLHTPGHLAEATGAALLGRMLGRLNGARDDPMRRALRDVVSPGPAPGANTDAFWLPGDLAAALPGPAALHRVAGRPGWRALTLWRGRIVVALWPGRAPLAVRRLIRRLDLPLRREPPRPVDSTALLDACELGLRRWLRAAAGLSLERLAARSGHVAATRTHLDVTFAADLIELQTRRLGLDISPGWCPWLARVVSIHYDFGGADG